MSYKEQSERRLELIDKRDICVLKFQLKLRVKYYYIFNYFH